MIDSHCHIYATELAHDLNAVLERADNAGVKKIYMPAIDSSTHKSMLDLAEKFSICLPMMGLHPCSVKENFKEELQIIENYLKTQKFAAIGETGLDFYWDKSFIKEQVIALKQQADWCLKYNLPIVLHTRDAMDETIAEMQNYTTDGLQGVFHCFGGTLQQAEKIMDMGFYLGIGGVVTFKNSGLSEVLKHIPLSSLLLETDAPFLAPVPYRGKRNEPAHLNLIAQKVAEIKQVSLHELIKTTTENAEKLFKL